ncbi:MAG: hypothetical protein ACREB5_03275, partial [Sphingomonadaceae bacterium]
MRIIRTLMPLLAALCAVGPAYAEKDISPYIEVQQVIDADLDDGGEVLTYTAIAVGVDASVTGNRAQGQISYRYEHRFGYGDNASDENIHSGLARGAIEVVPDLLSFEGGALATRSRVDIRGAAPDPALGGNENTTQIYSLYAGPTLRTMIGDVGVNAAYRIGYTKTEANTDLALPPGQQPLDLYDDSTSHLASVSVSQRPGALPFGWSINAGYEREDAG